VNFLKSASVAKLVLAAAALSSSAFSMGQSMTLMDLMKGDKVPLTMMADKIPDGYMAMKIKTPGGGGGLMDLLGGTMGMMMGALGGGSDMAQSSPLQAMEVSWTKGEMVTMSGAAFVLTYKMDIGMAEMAGFGDREDALQKTPMRLVLVRMDAIQSISPLPDLTRERFYDMLKKPPTPPAPDEPEEEPPMEEEEEGEPPVRK
jgi:hypothetical protein